MSTQLICTFTTKNEVHDILNLIIDNFIIVYNKIFVLSIDTPLGVVCSYNIEISPNVQFLPNSILVHRKKENNVIYSINALNEIIMKENNGILNKSFQIDWARYRNCILLTEGNELKKHNTEIFFVKNINV